MTLKKNVDDIVSKLAALTEHVKDLQGRRLGAQQRDSLREANEELRAQLGSAIELTNQAMPLYKQVEDIVVSLEALGDAVDSLRGRGISRDDRANLRKASEELRAQFRSVINPRAMPPAVFDPSDTRVFGRVAAMALLAQERIPLSTIPNVYGSGVYALYFLGKSPLYQAISHTATPIYVGKSTPPDGAITVIEQDNALTTRLGDHRSSIDHAVDLGLAEFQCRFLVVASGWESPAELELIRYFRPVWNKGNGIEPVHGFGNHDPGSGRGDGRKSEWDTLHGGRSSKSLNKNEKTKNELENQVARHFKEVPAVAGTQAVIDDFLQFLASPPMNI
ncbi:Eco29kI family restriction endonuclease [Dietzia alimentaria]|uniref:Eco29kI family restriction endonuclease n=1 Tax=Dietzia alimentaria TaxID=665550 RepID=UPI0002F3C135|nr:Eco29kI family restriction endonuclease [Dietzia alimentaria]